MPKKRGATLNGTAVIKNLINDKDWREIIRIRSCKKLEKILKFLRDRGLNRLGLLENSASRKKLSENLITHQISIFYSNELERYRKRYPKSNYIQDINEAKTKNLKLFRIIKWDKAWIYAEWVKKKVIDAQEDRDLKFLKDLGEAIARKPQAKKLVEPHKSKNKGEKEFILIFMECYVAAAVTKYSQAEVYQMIKKVYEKLLISGVLPDELLDFNYFMRYLRRHDVIL